MTKVWCPNHGRLEIDSFSYNQCPICGSSVKIETNNQRNCIEKARKEIIKKLKNYKVIIPITAETLPPKEEIFLILKKINDMNQSGCQIWDKIRKQGGNQIWDQIRNKILKQGGHQIRNLIWNPIWKQGGHQILAQDEDLIWDLIRAQVENKIWDPIWHQIRNLIRNQIKKQGGHQIRNKLRQGDGQARDQVWAQAWVAAYFGVKKLLNLDYEHAAFDLIRLGILVVKIDSGFIIDNSFKIFGKNGKFLGKIETNNQRNCIEKAESETAPKDKK